MNKYLTAEEAAYIVNDSGAKALVTSAALRDAAEAMLLDLDDCPLRLAIDGTVSGFHLYEAEIEKHSPEPRGGEQRGDFMNYSSGTTGRPKGIKRPLSGEAFTEPSPLDGLINKPAATINAVDRVSRTHNNPSQRLTWR